VSPFTIIALHGIAFILAVSWGGWPVAVVWATALLAVTFIEYKSNR
jgi:hypothetical protein